MNPIPVYDAPLLKRSRSLRMHETLLERTIVPVVTLAITVTLSVLWHLHRDELLQRLALENRARIMGKMSIVIPVLFLGCALFLVEGILRPSNRRKGSARLQWNHYQNVLIAITLHQLRPLTTLAFCCKMYNKCF
ncbi:TMV resistance protein N-like protein [Corchorus olitorius]|uniref:TMV resistance protein N-like protein n=1 Tax=Corchorus olitorius TaxID=93759 RepID=A0A1R3KYQ5_9ROSI|nr:TMV resistance protein N-like protein [Corchorus olitorius]